MCNVWQGFSYIIWLSPQPSRVGILIYHWINCSSGFTELPKLEFLCLSTELACLRGLKVLFPLTEPPWVRQLLGAILPFSFPSNRLLEILYSSASFFFTLGSCITVQMCRDHFNQPPINGHLGSFHSFIGTCNSAPSKLLHKFLCILRSVYWDKLIGIILILESKSISHRKVCLVTSLLCCLSSEEILPNFQLRLHSLVSLPICIPWRPSHTGYFVFHRIISNCMRQGLLFPLDMVTLKWLVPSHAVG